MLLRLIDWFVPHGANFERSELSMARNFVFTHLVGPILCQGISIFLYVTDPAPGFACWTVIIGTWSFLALPFAYKLTGNLRAAALISVELLAFTALFGAFHYGGVSSPFLPWVLISLLLGFFYLSDRPGFVLLLFLMNVGVFVAAYMVFGFSTTVPVEHLAPVGWISILSATVYMSWMAVYYANIVTMRSDVERETLRHRDTADSLRRAKERADKNNEARSTFLAKMSHELRTPLNAVIGYSEILIETCEEDQNAGTRADLERINAAGKHLLSLVADVLDMSKIESNDVEMRVEKVDVYNFALEVVATTQGLVAARGNELLVECPPYIGWVMADPTKLRQIALNLISNAAKFTSRGTITLGIRRDVAGGASWLELEVRDTGIGISPEGIDRLFKDFGQATSMTASQYGGTGLGLVISQRLCNLMGGGIAVTSVLGRGSSFVARIQADIARPETAASPALACVAA
jgi:signal transduction histidine kinase